MSKFQNFVAQPLAFYEELTTGDRRYQNYNLHQCQGKDVGWKLWVVASIDDPDNPGIHVPAFQIKTTPEPGMINSFYLRSVDGTINTALNDTFFTIEDLGGGYWTVLFDGTNFIPLAADSIAAKEYYFTVSDGFHTWYSEVLEFVDEDDENTNFPAECGEGPWMLIRWTTDCIISQTVFNAGTFHLFLLASLGQPTYEYQDGSEDDGDGGLKTYWRRLDKRWEVFITAPEYIADAMTSLQMYTNVVVEFQGGDSLACRDIKIDVDWIDSCFARITFSFAADFLARTACCPPA